VLVVRPPVLVEPSEHILVRDVMSRPAVTASPETTVRDIARLMLERNVGSVVIVDADDQLAGIVTEADFEISDEPVPDTTFRWPRFLGKHVWSEESLEEVYAEAAAQRADAVMTTPVETVSADTDLWDAVRALTEKGHRRLPVVDRGQLVGVVSQTDLVKLLLARRD
jgi:CBS domain-containing protein